MITYEEVKEIYDDEIVRKDMLKKTEAIFATIDRRLRNRECMFRFDRNSIMVQLQGKRELGDAPVDDNVAHFVAEEYVRNGHFPQVVSSGNSVLKTLIFEFFLEKPKEDDEHERECRRSGEHHHQHGKVVDRVREVSEE